MKRIAQRIKQRFCHHIDHPNDRNHQTPFVGYMFQCPKCKGYVAYFKYWDDFINVSEKRYNIFAEEGVKLWEKTK